MEDKDVKRFWKGVERGSPDECWPWRRSVRGGGYGQFHTGSHKLGTRKMRAAHVVACELANGPPPPGKPHALHAPTCTTRLCCNGAHLRWGSHTQNMRDKMASGTQHRPSGWPARKLSDEEVDSIRLSEESCTVLGRRYGVSTAHISRIKRGFRRKT